MKMLLIDGNSMLFRGYYATCYGNMMKTSTGVYTNAVFAFANMLNKALDMLHPEYCLVAFDKGKHTFRHDIDASYKGGRNPAPDELVPQFGLVRDYLSAYNIPFLEYDDIEADDIIGSVAKKYPDVEICILTSDRDLLQLIDDTTTVYLMKKGLTDIAAMDADGLKEEWGVRPNQVADLKGLMGDSSDNIKGVKGIGQKTATKLIQQYENIDGLYAHIDELKGKQKENLINDKDICYLSKRLATIKTDVEIEEPLQNFALNLNDEGVNNFYTKYEMLSLRRNHSLHTEPKKLYKRVSCASEKALQPGTFVFFDNDEFKYYAPKIDGLVFANEDVIEYLPFEDFLKDENAKNFIKSDEHFYTYNLKFILHAFDYHHLTIGPNCDDLMLMSFLADNRQDDLNKLFSAHSLDVPTSIEDIYGTVRKPKMVDTIAQTNRAGLIADNCFKVIKDIEKTLNDHQTMHLYRDIELPLTYVLKEMEDNGIHCDAEVLKEISLETLAKMDEISRDIYLMAHHEFNINSPKQLAEVLFDELGLPAASNPKHSTSVEVLESIEAYHPIVSLIMQYRKYAKLNSTYAEGLSGFIGDDQKIHTIFQQTVTQTGRLSSKEPNLQNISVRDEEARSIRKAFMASDKNHILVSSDYSQIELRMLASMADETKMIDAFNHNVDIHTKTAMEIFGLSAEEVDSNIRRKAKAINFGVVYGISGFGLAKQAMISVAEATRFKKRYFEIYPNIKRFEDESIDYCFEHGYVNTIMNRRRYIDEIHAKAAPIREFGKRAAVNSRVQGSAADLIKIAMINISNEIKKRNLNSKLILQIHDELIFDVDLNEEDEMINIIKEGMRNAMELNVNLDSSLGKGYTWYEVE